MSTHNVCFESKIRKLGIPLQTPFFYIKVGFKGVSMSRTCFADDVCNREYPLLPKFCFTKLVDRVKHYFLVFGTST